MLLAEYLTISNYLSLKRKNPVMDENERPIIMQPVQLIVTLWPSLNNQKDTVVISYHGIIVNAVSRVIIHPTKITIADFCLSFILLIIIKLNEKRRKYGKK